MEQIEEVKALLSFPKKEIVITSHRNPDGDAIGSSLGLYHYLVQLGHSVQIALPSEYPPNFAWMPDVEDILVYDIHTEETTFALQKAEIIFALDYNDLQRIDKMGELIAAKNVPKILIDHHLYPEPFADYYLSDTTASSTSELIYDFIVLLGDKTKVNHKVADCLYTGLMTDTGCFKYSISPKTFQLAAHLMALGVDGTLLYDLVFNSLEEKHLRLLGHCLNNRMQVFPEYRTGLIYLTKKDYEQFGIQRGDTEGIVNYLLTLKNLKMAAFITEQPTGIVKVSLRSKGDFSVQDICRQYFNGGGHKNASGGFVHAGLKAALDKFKEILPIYKDRLLS